MWSCSIGLHGHGTPTPTPLTPWLPEARHTDAELVYYMRFPRDTGAELVYHMLFPRDTGAELVYHMLFPGTLSFWVNEEKEGAHRVATPPADMHAPGSQLRVELLHPVPPWLLFFEHGLTTL